MSDAVLEVLRSAMRTAHPDLDAVPLAFYGVVRDLAGRYSLQTLRPQDGLPDALPVNAWHGAPGISSDPTPGEHVVVAFVGKDAEPVLIARSPRGEQGHVPIRVRHEASTEIRLVQHSDGVVRVGPDLPTPPEPVALAPALRLYLEKLEAWAYQVDIVLAVLLSGVIPPNYGQAIEQRVSAAGYAGSPLPPAPLPEPATFDVIVAARLESV